ncbi:MAG: hypothetical protein C0483_04330 [Pirellula sp.]|nr:hypothetical protein [Pirellula sp.]
MSSSLDRRIAAAQRRWMLVRFVRALPWCATVSFLAAAAAIVAGKYMVSGPAWSTLLGAATGATLGAALVWSIATRPAHLQTAVELDKRCGLQERLSSALSTRAGAADNAAPSPMAEAVYLDAERAAERVDAKQAFPLTLPRRAAWPLVPAAIAVGLAIWFTPQITTNPAGETVEAAPTAQVQEHAKELVKKLEERRKEAELMKLAEAQRLLDKLREEALKLQSADKVGQKDALLQLSDMASELAERRKDVGAAQQLQKELSKLRSKKKGPADEFSEALSQGNYRGAADKLEQLRKELAAKQLDPEKKKQLEQQLEQLQKQLEQMADARKEMQKDLEQKARDAAEAPGKSGEQSNSGKQGGDANNPSGAPNPGERGGDDPVALAESLSQLAAENSELEALKNSFEQAAQSMQSGDDAGAEKSLESLQEQLEQMAQQAGESELLQKSLDDLAECKSGMCAGGKPGDAQQGQQGGKEQRPGAGQQGVAQGKSQQGRQPGGLQPGRGVGPGLGKESANTDGGGGFDSRVRGDVGAGPMRAVGPTDGPNAKGKVLDTIRRQADAVAGNTETQKLEHQALDRSRREQKKQYFDALRQP